MPATRPRPDFAAHQRAVRAPFTEVARAVRELLGARLAAYVGGVTETRAVREWAEGKREPGDAVKQRFRVTLQVALMLEESDGREVTQAWFQGLNPQLDDRSPARLLREGEVEETGPQVLEISALMSLPGFRVSQA